MRISQVFGLAVFAATMLVGVWGMMVDMLTLLQAFAVAVIYGALAWGLVWLNEN